MQEILKINPNDFEEKILSEQEIIELFDRCNAVWIHDGNPAKPHAELISGLCSNGYFNCPEVLKFPNLCQLFAWQLTQKLVQKGIMPEKIDWVVGSPYAAITYSFEVAKALSAIHGFTEKDPTDPKGKRFVWRRMKIPRHAVVLQIEELITTSRTFKEVRRAVNEGNAEHVKSLPFVGTLIHRPPKLPVDYDGIEVISLVEKVIWAVRPEECPLCEEGSPRYRPKSHWAELTGKK
jgi:orotate phosphoribosyltransferase